MTIYLIMDSRGYYLDVDGGFTSNIIKAQRWQHLQDAQDSAQGDERVYMAHIEITVLNEVL